MATGMVAAGANTALDALVVANTWIKAHIGDPGSAGTSNAAVETTRKQATWRASASGATSQSNALTWTNVAATEDWTFFSAMTASSAGAVGFTGTVTANALVAGDTMTVAVDDLDASFTLAS